MSALLLIPAFIFGVVTGMFISFQLAGWLAKRTINQLLKPRMDELKAEGQELDKQLSVQVRLNQVADLTEEQLDLHRISDGPQRNAMDGKYKNGVNGRIKQLEEEKAAILKSILDEGLDPVVRTQDSSGVQRDMKLSEFMGYGGEPIPPEPPPAKTKQVGKFTVYKGGKDDGGNTSH